MSYGAAGDVGGGQGCFGQLVSICPESAIILLKNGVRIIGSFAADKKQKSLAR